MIAFLSGLLKSKTEEHAVIDVGGVGFKVAVPLSTYRELPRIGEPVTLHTILWVREDDLRLYGFASEEEREMFQVLLGVKGVGAKMAIDIVSFMPVARLVEAIRKDQPALLCQIPGIGKKRAERLIFDLKNNSHPLFLRPVAVAAGKMLPRNERVTEAIEALMALG